VGAEPGVSPDSWPSVPAVCCSPCAACCSPCDVPPGGVPACCGDAVPGFDGPELEAGWLEDELGFDGEEGEPGLEGAEDWDGELGLEGAEDWDGELGLEGAEGWDGELGLEVLWHPVSTQPARRIAAINVGGLKGIASLLDASPECLKGWQIAMNHP